MVPIAGWPAGVERDRAGGGLAGAGELGEPRAGVRRQNRRNSGFGHRSQRCASGSTDSFRIERLLNSVAELAPAVVSHDRRRARARPHRRPGREHPNEVDEASGQFAVECPIVPSRHGRPGPFARQTGMRRGARTVAAAIVTISEPRAGDDGAPQIAIVAASRSTECGPRDVLEDSATSCAGQRSGCGDVADAAREFGFSCRCAALRRSHSHIIARMRTVDVIRRKRDGGALRRDEIEHFVAGVTNRHHSRLPGRGAADGDRAARHDRRRDRAAHRRDGALRRPGRLRRPATACRSTSTAPAASATRPR